MSFVGVAIFPSSRWPSWGFSWLLVFQLWFLGSWIWISNSVPFVVNVLIKGEIEKPSDQYLGLIVMSHWHAMVWIRIWDISAVLRYYLCSCGESHLLVSWCVGDRCDMGDNNEDHAKSRRPSAENWGWSSTDRVLGGWTIRRSSHVVCGLHCAYEDKERGFLGLASKPKLMVSRFVPQNW
jgi:hypothetical protein